jgi:hypothetical protein
MRAFVLTMLVAVLAGCVAAQVRKQVWDFDSATVGELPQGVTNEVGEWKVAADDTAPSRPSVLAQMAKNSGGTYNVALLDGTSYQDLDLTVAMKAVAGEEDQGGGPVWRAKDKENYYIARYNPLENNYRVYKTVNGRRQQLGTADVKGDLAWHTLRIVMNGDHIECYLDGTKYLDVRDATFGEAGKIGLWTKADAQTHFDNVEVAMP